MANPLINSGDAVLVAYEKLKNCGYQFKWSFEEALEDWFEDNERKCLK